MKTFTHPARRRFPLPCLIFLLAGVFHGATATFTVSSTANTGPGSLRNTVFVATNGDTIEFAAGISGQTILLTGGPISISRDITLDASALAEKPAISGNDASQIFRVTSGADVTMRGLKFVSGASEGEEEYPTYGGAVNVSNATLRMEDCVFEGNRVEAATAGGALACIDGVLELTDCVFRNNRTGIYNPFFPIYGGGALFVLGSTATLDGCDFIDNYSGQDAGALQVWTDSAVTVRNSSFVENEAYRYGGAILNSATLALHNCTIADNTAVFGAGVFSTTDLATLQTRIINSTFVRNIATGRGGAIYNNIGRSELIHCTITDNTASDGNGAGVASYGAADTRTTVQNSIIAGNNGTDVDLAFDPENSFVSLGHNLIGSGGSTGAFNEDGDNTGVGALWLAPLADYGGPTLTRPPLPGSPAIEAGAPTASTPETDQRGAARVTGQAPDIGAVEAFAFSSLPLVDTDDDGIDDRLEPAYGFVVGEDESAVDSDGDGQTDAVELANMTNPNNANSLFKITAFAPAGTEPGTGLPLLTFTFISFPGVSYEVETASDVTFESDVSQTPVIANGTTHQATVALPAPNAFLRVRR